MIAELTAILAIAAPGHCSPLCKVRVINRERRRVVAPYDAKLNRMAHCETRNQWHITSPSGTYRGGLQFDWPTWRSVGGKLDPIKATILEQKYRAVLLIKRRGYQPWPVCGSA